MLYLDGIGVSLFAIQGADKVFELDFALPLGPIILGVITALGGGLIRNVLSGKPTFKQYRNFIMVTFVTPQLGTNEYFCRKES